MFASRTYFGRKRRRERKLRPRSLKIRPRLRRARVLLAKKSRNPIRRPNFHFPVTLRPFKYLCLFNLLCVRMVHLMITVLLLFVYPPCTVDTAGIETDGKRVRNTSDRPTFETYAGNTVSSVSHHLVGFPDNPGRPNREFSHGQSPQLRA